jgi:hypothetical protein
MLYIIQLSGTGAHPLAWCVAIFAGAEGSRRMSLRKSPTMTPVRLEANRCYAKKSTGPRTADGKARSRMNGLKCGDRSSEFRGLFDASAYDEPGAILRAESCLTRAQESHPAYLDLTELFTVAEIQTIEDWRPGNQARSRILERHERSLNVL